MVPNTEKTIIAKPAEAAKGIGEKNENLKWEKTLLNQVKRYVDNHLNLAKVDIIDPRKENFVQPLSIPEILAELQIADVGYCTAFSISKDDYFELHPSEKETKFLFCK